VKKVKKIQPNLQERFLDPADLRCPSVSRIYYDFW